MLKRIRELYWAKPFRPFSLHLADGQKISATHPELIALSASTKEIVVLDPDGAAHFVNMDLVTEIKMRPKKADIAN